MFGRDAQSLVGIETEDGFDLFEDFVDAGDREVDLVDDGDDRQVGFQRRIRVGDGLCLNALKRINKQQGPFAGGERPGHLVMEVDVTGSIDQVEFVGFAVVSVIDCDGPRFDGDSAVAFDVEIVEDLFAEFALGDRTGLEQQLVGQCALSVIDMRNDREVTDEPGVHWGWEVAPKEERIREPGKPVTPPSPVA